MKKKKGKKNGLSELIEKFNERKSKGNIENTLLKGLVDVAGVAAGTGLGALSRKHSKFVGLGTLLSGHFLGDKTGVLRIVGASTLAYGIGKAKEYESNPDLQTTQGRLSDLKDNWLATLYIKMKNEKAKEATSEPEVTVEPIKSEPTIAGTDNVEKETKKSPSKEVNKDENDFSNLDFSRLDLFEDDILQSAKDFQESDHSTNTNVDDDFEDELDNPDFSMM